MTEELTEKHLQDAGFKFEEVNEYEKFEPEGSWGKTTKGKIYNLGEGIALSYLATEWRGREDTLDIRPEFDVYVSNQRLMSIKTVKKLKKIYKAITGKKLPL